METSLFRFTLFLFYFLVFPVVFSDPIDQQHGYDKPKGNSLLEVFEGRSSSIVQPSFGVVVTMLDDIKNMLTEKNLDQESTNNFLHKLETFQNRAKDNFNQLDNKFADLSSDTNQKVDILLDSFSTLKLLVMDQRREIEDLKTKIRTEDFNPTDHFNSHVLNTDTNPSPINSFLKKEILSAVIPDSPDILSIHEGIATEKAAYISPKDQKRIENLNQINIKALSDSVNTIKEELTAFKTDFSSKINFIDKLQAEYLLSESNSSFICSCPVESFKRHTTGLQTQINQLVKEQNLLKGKAENLRITNDKLRSIEAEKIITDARLTKLEASSTEVKGQMEGLATGVNSNRQEVAQLESSLREFLLKLRSKEIVLSYKSEENSAPVLCVYPFEKKASGCFHIVKDKHLSWEDARKHCQSLQGELAAPLKFAEFKKYLREQRLSRSYNYWIGGTDSAQEGVWTWSSSNKLVEMGITVWMPGKPSQNKSNNCMLVNPRHTFVASDSDCSEKNYFICEQL